jgi:hypothetical protein
MNSTRVLFVFTLLLGQAVTSAQESAPELSPATGTWIVLSRFQGGQVNESVLNLKQDGETLTGTYRLPQNNTDVKVLDGVIRGKELSFKTTVRRNNQEFTAFYTGHLDGNDIFGTVETKFGNQNRRRDWEATREQPNTEAVGTWKSSYIAHTGQPVEFTLRLDQKEHQLSGVFIRQNGEEIPIEKGEVKDGKLRFMAIRDRGGQPLISRFEGKIDRSEVKGSFELDAGSVVRTHEWKGARQRSLRIRGASGAWKAVIRPQDGDPVELTLKLEQERNRLAGTAVSADGSELTLEDGKFEGNQLSFRVNTERDGRKVFAQFKGARDGNSIKGSVESDWSGESRTYEWEATR